MASILKKAQQKKEQSKTKAVTNLNVLNQQEVIEDKIAPSNTNTKKVEEDHEQIDLSNIKPVEKVVEETETVQTTTQKQNIENTTWVDTKDIDEQEALRIAALQVQTEKEDPNKGKKVMRSWVPQLREDGQAAVATFNEEASYFPEMDAEILTKKVEKKVASTTTISRADESNSSSNPPRFQNSNKGGFKQLELTEQQKKLLELDEQNKKEYRNPNNGPGFASQTEAADSFMPTNSSQPPRFMNKKANEGGNFVALQKSELDLKQEEAQKRAEERLKELKAAALIAAETKAEQANTGDDMRRAPRFTSSKTNNPEETEKKTETAAEESAKPVPKFMNANKSTQGPNFKPLETKEVKLPEVLENKKYLPKKGENDAATNNNKKDNSERKERKEKQQKEQSDDEDSEPEFDENGFKIVREEKRTVKSRNYKNGSNKNNKQASEKKKETQTQEQTQEIQA